MSKAIINATEKIKAAVKEQNSAHGMHLLCEAMNEISIEIGKAVAPLNHGNLPFIAAALTSYSDALIADMDNVQRCVYENTVEMLKTGGTIMKMEIPTRGGK